MNNHPTWFDFSENHKQFLVVCLAIFAAISLVATASFGWLNYDSFWHLRMGLDLVENGLSPWIDHYSFTFDGTPIHSPPVVFQTIYYVYTKFLGIQYGALALKLTFYFALLGLVLVWMKRVRAPVLAYFLCLPILVFVIQIRAFVRPELFSYLFMVGAFLLYYRAAQNLNARTMLPILLLMAVWSNIHSSILGYVIFFGMFLDIGIRLLKKSHGVKPWVNWGGWGLAIFLVGFLNPEFEHTAVNTILFPNEWKSMIKEYDPPLKLRYYAAIYPLIAICIASLFLAVRQRKVGYLIVLFVFFHSALTMTRMITPTSIVVICIFSHLLADADLGSILRRLPRVSRYALGLVSLLLFAVLTYQTTRTAIAFATDNIPKTFTYPYEIVRHMSTTNSHGRIFNEYGIGGFLLYNLAPHSKIYIDGRTQILYPLEFTKNYFKLRETPETLTRELDKWDIDYAIQKNNFLNARNFELSGFELEVADEHYSLFSRDKGALPILGRAWAFPNCWHPPLHTEAANEFSKYHDQVHELSALHPLSKFVTTYVDAADKNEIIESYDLNSLTSDASKRLFSYQALSNGNYELAVKAQNLLNRVEFKDVLVKAHSLIELGDFESAKTEINRTVFSPPQQVEFQDLRIQYELLKAIDERIGLDERAKYYFNHVSEMVGNQALSQVSFGDFCDPVLQNK